jgi:flagellar hook-associated protein 1 FlgK
MPSILSGFDTVQQALAAQQYALSITQRNVANANNPAYTRQEVLFSPVGEEDATPGIPGVSLRSVRDRFIDFSISQEMQSLAEHTVAYDALQRINAVFSGNAGQDLQQAISNFFNSFGSLASAPEDPALRQQVLENANALTREFHRVYAGIQQVQTSQDYELTYAVEEINSITARIADLNEKVVAARGLGSEDEFVLRDARQQLVEQLSGLIDLSFFETESGSITVTTRQGDLMVIGDQSSIFELAPMAAGAFRGVLLDGNDITPSLESGKLGGLIDVRDNKIAGYLNALDDMAATIISRVNEQHALGWDLDGLSGGDFFTPFTPPGPGSNEGAARMMSVAVTDTRRIAAAATGAGAGNNVNAMLIADISEENLFSSSTATLSQFYASLVFRMGSDGKAAEEGMLTQNSVLEQLKNQRDAFSGVNLDEEAISIVKYQKAYQASARYANILDVLSDEILQLLGV